MTDPGRRPIEPWEVAGLEALGSALRSLRLEAGLTRMSLGVASELSYAQVTRIESGTRRTRRSTLLRLSRALCAAVPELGDPEPLVDELVATAGDSLAPESPYQDRIARRRERRKRRTAREIESYARQFEVLPLSRSGADEKTRVQQDKQHRDLTPAVKDNHEDQR
jgi:transcriptional regulator with XRE-family HTH domain